MSHKVLARAVGVPGREENPSSSPAPAERKEFLPQSSFAAVLRQERRRAERSGRQFALMLLDGKELSPAANGYGVLQTIATTLANAMRETDVVGWYEYDGIAGVILTELGEGDMQAALNGVEQRVSNLVRNAFPAPWMNSIRISFHIFPEQWNFENPGGGLDARLYPDLRENSRRRRTWQVLKRGIDIFGSLLCILLASPLLILCTLAILATSPGPVLFRQQRIGRYGIPFVIYKFRSMHIRADPAVHEAYVRSLIEGRAAADDKHKIFKLCNDSRITWVGRIMRRTSLDELPQLFNVLKGDMSLIGPRPPILYEVVRYRHWHRRRLLAMRPGLTGLWQVSGRCRLPFDEMVRLDLLYADRQSLWLDLRILLKTPWAIVSGDGAL
jgi:lipopolysaccharide/colanic/teichoic acid biosynthesis glycosyltransferase